MEKQELGEVIATLQDEKDTRGGECPIVFTTPDGKKFVIDFDEIWLDTTAVEDTLVVPLLQR